MLERLEKKIDRSASGRNINCALGVFSGLDWIGWEEDGCGLICWIPIGVGSIYKTSFEIGDAKLNSENVMEYFWQQMLVNWDLRL